MKKILTFFLSIFFFTTVFGQEAVFKHVRNADSIRLLIENTKSGGAPVNLELKNTEGSASLRLDEDGDFTIDGGNYINIPEIQNSLVGAYYDFNGSNDNIIITDNSNLDFGTQNFSYVFRLKTLTLSETIQGIYSKHLASLTTNAVYFNDAKLRFYVDIGYDFSNFLIFSDLDKWLNIVITREGQSVKAYKNGIYFGEVTVPAGFDLDNANDSYIGSRAGADALYGDFSMFLSYNRLLTSSEIIKMALWDSDNPPILFPDVGASNTEWTTDGALDEDNYGFETCGGDGVDLTGVSDWTVSTCSFDSDDEAGSGVTTYNETVYSGKLHTITGGGGCYISLVYGSENILELGKRYRISFDYKVANVSNGLYQIRADASSGSTVKSGSLSSTSWTTISSEFISTKAGDLDGRIVIWGSTTTSDGSEVVWIDNVSFTQIGCVGNWNASGMADDYWYDNSGNELDGTNNGATLIRNSHTVLNTLTLDNSGDIRPESDSGVDAGTMHAYIDNLIPSAVESGTADGQMLFWNTDAWKHSETSELFWDDTSKYFAANLLQNLDGQPYSVKAQPQEIMRPVVSMNGAAGIDILGWQVKSIDDTIVSDINYVQVGDMVALNNGNAFYVGYNNTLRVLKIINPAGDTIITVDPMFTRTIDGIHLALLPNGNILALFEDNTLEHVWMAIFDEQGNTVLSELELLDYQIMISFEAHLIVLPNGNLFFTYVNWDTGYDCFVIFDQQGNIIKSEVVFSTYNDWHSLPAVLLNNGNILIGVSKGGNATQYIIYDSNGNLVKALTDQDDDYWWEMKLLDNGNVFILGKDGSNGRISIVSPNGDSIKSINTAHATAMYKLVQLPNGNIMVVYNYASDVNKGYYSIYDKNANVVKSSTKFADHYVRWPTAVILSDGDVAIVYAPASSAKVTKLAILEGTGINIAGAAILGISGQVIAASDSGVSAGVIHAYINEGWKTWAPSLTWVTNTPTVNSAVYRYSKINKTVHFIVDIRTTNNSGGNVEGLIFPLPITPKKIDVILPVSGQHTIGSYQLAVVYIDCEEALAADRTLHYRPFVFATATSASFYVSGFYEIE